MKRGQKLSAEQVVLMLRQMEVQTAQGERTDAGRSARPEQASQL
jgi:hypothetical protein